ncbi:MAG: TetR/AcrR family transcriptional regulator [Streptomycetaceae bacterium]|nr:TetR/AcrR family transcriptional regulator [Streptomycetaceae bacterium]
MRADRATDRSPAVQRSRARSVQQMSAITRAAYRLIREKGTAFTTQDLSKEAGLALQTIYRHFTGKDQILLAVVEEVIADQSALLAAAARELPDPVARLRFYVTSTLDSLRGESDHSGPQFITAEHWRLHQLFPDDMAHASQPFGDLVERELREAVELGLLRSHDPAADAWFVMKLVMSVYHHYAFATAKEPIDDIARQLWSFCLTALGGEPGGGEPGTQDVHDGKEERG